MVEKKKDGGLKYTGYLFLAILFDFVIDLCRVGKSVFGGFVAVLGAVGFLIYGVEFLVFLLEHILPILLIPFVVILLARASAIIISVAFLLWFFRKEFKRKENELKRKKIFEGK